MEAGSRRTISYVSNITSWKLRLLCRNHEECLVDLDSEHTATNFLRHLHLKPSRLGSLQKVISQQRVLHVTLLRIDPTFFRNWMPRSRSMKSYVSKNLFESPSFPGDIRPKDDRGTKVISIRRCWYFDITLWTWSTIISTVKLNSATQYNTKQPDKLPQQRIPHWRRNATAWVGVGRKARKTWGPYCTIKDLSQNSCHRCFIKFFTA